MLYFPLRELSFVIDYVQGKSIGFYEQMRYGMPTEASIVSYRSTNQPKSQILRPMVKWSNFLHVCISAYGVSLIVPIVLQMVLDLVFSLLWQSFDMVFGGW